jgi:transcriptional regulator with XRE-family HTH domain
MAKQPVFGDILRAAREAQGMSHRALAEASGVASGNISAIETGKINPTFRTIKLLATGLGAQLVIGFKPDDTAAPAAASDQDRPQSTHA